MKNVLVCKTVRARSARLARLLVSGGSGCPTGATHHYLFPMAPDDSPWQTIESTIVSLRTQQEGGHHNGESPSAPAMQLSDLAHEAAHEFGVMRVADATYYRKYKPAARCLIRFFGDVDLGDLEPKDIDSWQKHQEKRDITITTANMYKATVRAMLNKLGHEDLGSVIATKDAGPLKARAMSDDHFERILRHANLRDAAVLLLLRHSGRRRGTICHLRMADTKIWQSPEGDFRLASKSIEKGDKRVLVFAKHRAALATMLWLESRPDPDSQYVFTHLDSGRPLLPNAITATFHRLKRAARIPKDVQISPHTLRHRFAQDKLEQFDAKIVADWMGIEVETLLQVYATRSEDTLERLFFEDDSA